MWPENRKIMRTRFLQPITRSASAALFWFVTGVICLPTDMQADQVGITVSHPMENETGSSQMTDGQVSPRAGKTFQLPLVFGGILVIAGSAGFLVYKVKTRKPAAGKYPVRRKPAAKAPAPAKTLRPKAPVPPVTPVFSESIKPAVPDPVEPVVAKEVEPVIAKPVEPVVAKEVEPVIAKPVEPVIAKEAEPVIAKPVEPVIAKEAEPVIAKPVEPVVAKEAETVKSVPPESADPVVAQRIESTDAESDSRDITEPEKQLNAAPSNSQGTGSDPLTKHLEMLKKLTKERT
jgi:hypothetical protein